jgi:hypothetical protein
MNGAWDKTRVETNSGFLRIGALSYSCGGFCSAKQKRTTKQREKRKEGDRGKMTWIVLADSVPPNRKEQPTKRKEKRGGSG